MYHQVVELMKQLRRLAQNAKPNNLKIHQWVDGYIDSCLSMGESVNIHTPWCVPKSFQARHLAQGEQFVPTKEERELFTEAFPEIVSLFRNAGISVNWLVTFHPAYLEERRLPQALQQEYQDMIRVLAKSLDYLLCLDWEVDVLGTRQTPNAQVLQRVEDFVTADALALEMKWNTALDQAEGATRSITELQQDIRYKIACKAEEGRYLTSPESLFPNGNFILVPVEAAERFDFHALVAPDFKQRIAAIVKPYPWRGSWGT